MPPHFHEAHPAEPARVVVELELDGVATVQEGLRHAVPNQLAAGVVADDDVGRVAVHVVASTLGDVIEGALLRLFQRDAFVDPFLDKRRWHPRRNHGLADSVGALALLLDAPVVVGLLFRWHFHGRLDRLPILV